MTRPTTLTAHCPRCDRVISASDEDDLVIQVRAHARDDHGMTHVLPRRHVLAQLQRQDLGRGGAADRGDGAGKRQTRGVLLDQGWRYDLMTWLVDTFIMRGRLRDLRRRTLMASRLAPGEALLDVGCGTGTLAIEAAALVGRTGRVAGIDAAPRQIGRARAKARRHAAALDVRVATIEALPYEDATFDVVTSTLVMHHLPEDVRRTGLAEIARVLRPGGRLVVCDFTGTGHPHWGHRSHSRPATGAALDRLVADTGFIGVTTEDVPFSRGHLGAAGAQIVVARKA